MPRYRRPSAADTLRGEIARERPEAANEYLARTLESYTSERMPGFQSELQQAREGAIRRGATGGDLGTSYEGDIISAFDRNTKNTAGRFAMDNYNTSRERYLDLLTGQRDYDTAQANAKRKRGGLFGKILGTVGGTILGGAGARIGEGIGDWVSDRFNR